MHYSVDSLESLLPEIYSLGTPQRPLDRKLRIAGLARLVQAFAFPNGKLPELQAGEKEEVNLQAEARWPSDSPQPLAIPANPVALEIMKSAAEELSLMVQKLYTQCEMASGVLACGEGVMTSPGFQKLLLAELATWNAQFRAIVFPGDILNPACLLLARL